MLQKLRGKGLFVFSDPGGAKPVLALVESIIPQLLAYKIISDRVYSFYKDFSVEVDVPGETPYDLLRSFKPDFVFTGTSYMSKIELDFIKVANALSIITFAFIDHWTFMRERFDNKGEMIFPDTII